MFDFLQNLLNPATSQGGGNFLDFLNFGQQNTGMPSNMKVLNGNPNDPEMQNFLGMSPANYAQLLQQNKVPMGGNFNMGDYINKPYQAPPAISAANPVVADNNQQQQQMLAQMLASRQPEQQQTPPVGAAPMPQTPLPTRFAMNNRPAMPMTGMPGAPQVMSPTRRRIIGSSLG